MDFNFFKKKKATNQHQDMRALKDQIIDMPTLGHRDDSIPAGPEALPPQKIMPQADERQETMPSPENIPRLMADPTSDDFDFPPAPNMVPIPEPEEEYDEQLHPEEYEEPRSNRTLRSIKGPVFISLKKYKELRSHLTTLKDTSDELKSILNELKNNRDGGFDLLEASTDHLIALEKQAEAINKLVKN